MGFTLIRVHLRYFFMNTKKCSTIYHLWLLQLAKTALLKVKEVQRFCTQSLRSYVSLPESRLNSEFYLSVFSRIRTEYEEIWSISRHSVRMGKNTNQKNSEYRKMSRSIYFCCSHHKQSNGEWKSVNFVVLAVHQQLVLMSSSQSKSRLLRYVHEQFAMSLNLLCSTISDLWLLLCAKNNAVDS